MDAAAKRFETLLGARESRNDAVDLRAPRVRDEGEIHTDACEEVQCGILCPAHCSFIKLIDISAKKASQNRNLGAIHILDY
jgi:hypothetical protein